MPSAAVRSFTIMRPLYQVISRKKSAPPMHSGSQPPCSIFSRLAPKKPRSTRKNTLMIPRHERLVPAPELGHHDRGEHRRDDHGRGDGETVRGREVLRTLEADHDAQDDEEQHPVHERNIDLPDREFRRVQDLHARHVAELDRLARQRIRARNDRLRRDHGRDRREDHERQQRPVGREQEERALDAPPANASAARPDRSSSAAATASRGNTSRGESASRRSGPCRRRALRRRSARARPSRARYTPAARAAAMNENA